MSIQDMKTMTEVVIKLTPGEMEEVLKSIRLAMAETPSLVYATDLGSIEGGRFWSNFAILQLGKQ